MCLGILQKGKTDKEQEEQEQEQEQEQEHYKVGSGVFSTDAKVTL